MQLARPTDCDGPTGCPRWPRQPVGLLDPGLPDRRSLYLSRSAVFNRPPRPVARRPVARSSDQPKAAPYLDAAVKGVLPDPRYGRSSRIGRIRAELVFVREDPATWMEPAIPVIRVTCPENVLTAQQKEQFAPLLIDAVMTQEVDPVTDVARNATFLVYNEVPQQNCFMGNEPF
jgi:phenylpyruvate tautomerase PptA (4-oxalocrotonate tautomerase family)